MQFIWLMIGAYLLGSFPTAYLFSKIFFGADIRKKGTGNVGTLNFLRTSGSKLLSLAVLIIDMGKGYLALWFAARYLESGLLIFPALAVLAGHIFPLWLKGKGGRGLATLAGIFLFLEPITLVPWGIAFAIVYFSLRKYILGVVVALFAANIIIALYFGQELFLISSSASLIVMLKYLPRLRDELTTS